MIDCFDDADGRRYTTLYLTFLLVLFSDFTIDMMLILSLNLIYYV